MMHKWKIEIGFRSGLIKTGIYEGDERDSGEVANKLFHGELNCFNGILDGNGGNLMFRLGDISFYTISI